MPNSENFKTLSSSLRYLNQIKFLNLELRDQTEYLIQEPSLALESQLTSEDEFHLRKIKQTAWV